MSIMQITLLTPEMDYKTNLSNGIFTNHAMVFTVIAHYVSSR